jgi:hypothetical protein
VSNPELAEAAEALAAEGLLGRAEADRLLRIARRELVSLRGGLRFALTCGILLVASGIGLFVKENAARIGPLAIAGGLTLAAAAALAFSFRGAPPFTWERVPQRGALCEGALLLGALLFASDLAFLETQLAVLGAAWPYHLLLVALVYAFLAYRGDSRPLLSMALTSFAAWRGVSRDLPFDVLFGRSGGFRVNALLCAAVFAAGAWHAASGRKRHFEPVYSNFAILLLLAALGAGAFDSHATWPLWTLLFAGTGVAVALAARKRKRPLWFAQGAVAVWLGLCRGIFEIRPEVLAMLVGALVSLGFFVLLVKETRSLNEENE